MQVTSGIQCNLLSPSYSTIYAPQGDAKSRFVLIQLLEGAAPWEVPAGASVIIRAAKPDGTFCFYDTNEAGDSAYAISGSTVTIELVGQVLAAPGPVLMQIDFYNADGAHLSTFSFCCQVSESVVADDDIVSSNYFSVLTATLTEMLQIEQAVKAAYGAPLVAATAAAMTDHTRVYVYTGSESGYTNGNWYYWNGTAWASGGVYNSSAVNVDSAPTQGSTNPVSSGGTYTAIANEAAAREAADTALGDDVDDLKSAFTHRTAGVLGSDGEADLDITDPNGNVLVRLADGEILTKNFDSSEIRMKNEDGGEADLDVSDVFGNVLARFTGGNFETKNFRGFQYVTFQSDPQVYTGVLPFTLTINHKFNKGDRIVLHVERGVTPWFVGSYVNYYVGSKKILDEGRGDNAWIEYVVTEDVESVSAVYTGAVSTTGMDSGTTFTFEVSLLGDTPILPTVVTVKQDGSGDFTTLRGALDSIGYKANDALNPYRIEIYPGVYDVLADYSDEEIANAEYNLYKFVGPVLYNGMYLVGMGNTPEETVLTASLDPEIWSDTIRGVISTLNCQGSCGFENLTIKAYNLRYCVHDDYTQPYIHRNRRIVKNAIFRGYNVAYTPCTTYGAGTRYATGVYTFENCDFGDNCGLHTSTNLLEPAFVHLINCKGHGFRIGDNETVSPVAGFSVYQFDGCDFLWINCRTDGEEPHVIVRGSGNSSPLYQFDPRTLYATGDVTIVPNVDKPTGYSGAGTVLEWYADTEHGPRFRPAASADTARGVVVWEDEEDTYIQVKGFVRTDRTPITSFALNDYVGIVNGALGIVSDASSAIGRVAYVDNVGAGYIKLNWRD